MTNEYDDFNLFFQSVKNADGHYTVTPPGAHPAQDVEFQLADGELENLLTKFIKAPYNSDGYKLTDEYKELRQFGLRLYQAFFSGNVRDEFIKASTRGTSNNKKVRVHLSLGNAQELAHLPWELLNDPQEKYLTLSGISEVARCLGLPVAYQNPEMPRPLRILAMAASPKDMTHLEIDGERDRLEQVLENARARGLVDLRWVKGETLPALTDELARGPWHIFHFFGHGFFDKKTGEASLALVDPASETSGFQALPASVLAQLLYKERDNLRLVFLNACEGSVSGLDPFGSAASELLKINIPAVIAMQHQISDQAAMEFASAFYTWLGEGEPVEFCMERAREQVASVCRNMEWAVPVLHQNTTDGQLFRIPAGHSPVQAQANLELGRTLNLTGLSAADFQPLLAPLLTAVRSLRGLPLPESSSLTNQIWLLMGEQARRWDPQRQWTPDGSGTFNLHPAQWAVERIAQHLAVLNPDAARALRDWNQAHAGDLGTDPGALPAVRDSFIPRPPSQPAEQVRSLLVYLWDATAVNEQLDPQKRDYTVDIHLWEAAGQSRVVWPAEGASASEARTSLAQLGERLTGAFETLETLNVLDRDRSDTLRIEFLTPLDLLDYGFENLPYGKKPDDTLGNVFNVVVRSLDRARRDLIMQVKYLGRWQSKWNYFQQQAGQLAQDPRGVFALRQDLENEQVLQKLNSEIERFYLTLLFDYSPGRDRRAALVWNKILEFGLPITLWPRAPLTAAQQDELRELLTSSFLNKLPQRVLLRRQAAVFDDSLGKKLSLLWDDPERLAQEGERFAPPAD